MQDESTPKEEIKDAQASPEADSPAAGAEAPAPEEASPDLIMAQLAEAQAKATENWERYLRATAEQDNIRKRAEREVDAARRFALEKFAQDMLGVRDSLELGLKSAQDAGASAAHVEGTELTLRMLNDVMLKHGIAVIDPKGEIFDPVKHEALSAVPSADAAPNTVLEVMQKGYSLNDRVLRPAMVVVARSAS